LFCCAEEEDDEDAFCRRGCCFCSFGSDFLFSLLSVSLIIKAVEYS